MRLRSENRDWSIIRIMSEIARSVKKPKHGGYYPYLQWARACRDYQEKAEKAYPSLDANYKKSLFARNDE